jgi:hypothetical protein
LRPFSAIVAVMHTLRFEEHGAPSVQRGEVAVVDAEVLEKQLILVGGVRALQA